MSAAEGLERALRTVEHGLGVFDWGSVAESAQTVTSSRLGVGAGMPAGGLSGRGGGVPKGAADGGGDYGDWSGEEFMRSVSVQAMGLMGAALLRPLEVPGHLYSVVGRG